MHQQDTIDNPRLSLPVYRAKPDIEYRGASRSKIENLAEASMRRYISDTYAGISSVASVVNSSPN